MSGWTHHDNVVYLDERFRPAPVIPFARRHGTQGEPAATASSGVETPPRDDLAWLRLAKAVLRAPYTDLWPEDAA